MIPHSYVHGRSEQEAERLHYQATKLSDLLHHDTIYKAGEIVLEAGCGVGAQTIILSKNSPDTQFVSVDISPDSLAAANRRVLEEGITNVVFRQSDVYSLPFEPETFDHVFVCFLLEHLHDPFLALDHLKRVIRPGGSITVIEGDHGSAFFYPDSPNARCVIKCLIDIQRQLRGNSLIGRELWHLMNDAGFTSVRISPRFVYADESSHEAVEGVKNIFIAMVRGVRDEALARRMIDKKTWDKGISDLEKTVGPGGTFCYTFFKATAIKRP